MDADLKDFFGSVDHEKLLTLVAQQIADGRVLRLIEAMPPRQQPWKVLGSSSNRARDSQGGVASPCSATSS